MTRPFSHPGLLRLIQRHSLRETHIEVAEHSLRETHIEVAEPGLFGIPWGSLRLPSTRAVHASASLSLGLGFRPLGSKKIRVGLEAKFSGFLSNLMNLMFQLFALGIDRR